MMITSRNTSLPPFLYAPTALLSLSFLPLFFCDVSRPRRRRRSTFDNVCERSTLFPTLFFLTATFFYRLWWGNPRRPPLFRLLLLPLLPSVSPSDRSLLFFFLLRSAVSSFPSTLSSLPSSQVHAPPKKLSCPAYAAARRQQQRTLF